MTVDAIRYRMASLMPYDHLCFREVYGLMTECWGPSAACRPGPREIELFLQRKNLGFRPEQ